MPKTPKLSLDLDEQFAIREAGLSLSALTKIDAAELAALTNIPLPRCAKLIALSQFQTLSSVGPATAEDLWVLGYRTIDGLKGANPRQMYERLGRMAGQSLDPCVEDTLRCAVAQASFSDLPDSLYQWWMWSDQRGESSVRLPESEAD